MHVLMKTAVINSAKKLAAEKDVKALEEFVDAEVFRASTSLLFPPHVIVNL